MFDWVLRTPSICSANQLTDLFDMTFYKLVFSDRLAIEIWILIPIILLNISKLHTKKVHSRYGKIHICKKNPHKNYPREKKY